MKSEKAYRAAEQAYERLRTSVRRGHCRRAVPQAQELQRLIDRLHPSDQSALVRWKAYMAEALGQTAAAIVYWRATIRLLRSCWTGLCVYPGYSSSVISRFEKEALEAYGRLERLCAIADPKNFAARLAGHKEQTLRIISAITELTCEETGSQQPGASAEVSGKELRELFFYEKCKARDGDREAQCYVALCYDTGDPPRRNYSKARYWYECAAEQGDAYAMVQLAELWHHGLGGPRNRGKALQWYRRAADHGSREGMYQVGLYLYWGVGTRKDMRTAVRWYRRAAERGHPFAQNNLGMCLRAGEGTRPNQKESAYWLGRAARQGDADAQSGLAYAYYWGKGVKQDWGVAAHWWRLAAQKGHQGAQRTLAELYREGEGVRKSARWAAFWEQKAREKVAR